MQTEFALLEYLIRPVKRQVPESGYHEKLFSWCKKIYKEKDRLMDVITMKIDLLEDDQSNQLLYIIELTFSLQETIRKLPEDQVDFERKFITETLQNMINFLQEEFDDRDPFLPGGLLHEEYKIKTIQTSDNPEILN